MFWLGLSVYLPFVGLLLIDEFLHHRKRKLTKSERWSLLADFASLWLILAYVLFVPYDSEAKVPFLVLSFLSFICVTKDEWWGRRECSKRERWVHTVLFMFHPTFLFVSFFLWAFIDGASLLAGWVLPFSTWGLRVLVSGVFAVFSAFLFYQIVCIRRLRKLEIIPDGLHKGHHEN